ncbi:MAG: hypothetical protein JWP94_2606 [Mucilaginibacter sp.]|jgi:hypothetical protein|nr:hypothetical protein [Mucilaginibacter sp.]
MGGHLIRQVNYGMWKLLNGGRMLTRGLQK